MKFKHIYIEITNICNLNCSFCDRTKKKPHEMTLKEFEMVLQRIDKYTDYVYLHVQGEPLLHKNIEDILKLCQKYHKYVNITTNGVFLKEKSNLLTSDYVRQINISLHSENNKRTYFKDIFDTIKKLDKNIYVSYRIWIKNKQDLILQELEKEYGSIVYDILNKKELTLCKNVFLSTEEEFVWPNINNDYYNDKGTCLGLKTHIGILSDGTVVVCCLDKDGISNLGNIFKEDLQDILDNNKIIIDNFKQNKCYLDLCKHCSFKERFK